MGWLTETLTSSIGRKVLMALTGLFLVLFLTIHLLGNLQLLANDGGESFNTYSYFMAHNGLIQMVSKLNFFFIALHAVVGIMLARKNKKARPIGYRVNAGDTNSSWASRSMALLGILTFLFLILLFLDTNLLIRPQGYSTFLKITICRGVKSRQRLAGSSRSQALTR